MSQYDCTRLIEKRDRSMYRLRKLGKVLLSVWHFYYQGFRQMGSLGRLLWIIILVKLFIYLVVVRVFFFRPVLSGLTDEEKSEVVADVLLGGDRE